MARAKKNPKTKTKSRVAKVKQAAKRRPVVRVLRWVAKYAALLVLLAVLWVLLYRVVDPPGGYYMLSERFRLGAIERDWRDMDEISPHMQRAAMAAEDANFCDHNGFDLAAIEAALSANAEGRALRGGSTISQQVAKNVFLWHGRSWVRKGLEAGFTLLIETLWPKRRILEVYLNIAEFDAGIFGVGAAARHHFGRTAGDLSLTQSARLAAVLPAPQSRNAAQPGPWTRKRARSIAGGAQTLAASGRADCLG
ncbi:MAG: monofunctional biosynthetic peptidoglycan transglycosylase [Pseudomonadota bacterium]